MKFFKKFLNHSDYESYIDSSIAILPNLSFCKDVNDVHLNQTPETRVVAKFNVIDINNETTIMYSNATNKFSSIEIDGIEQETVVSSYQFNTTGVHTVKYTLVNPTTLGAAFNLCKELIYVAIPNTVTSLESLVFQYCENLTSINIPKNVASINDLSFVYCFNLTSITVDKNNPYLDSRDNCNAIIETSTNTLVLGCQNTIIPNTVTSIKLRAFYSCKYLKNITIPNSVTSIGAYAFLSCTGLTNITIPNSVTSIATRAFYGCSNVSSIICNATTAPTIQSNTFQNVKTDGTLYVPTGSTGYDVWMGSGNYYLGLYNWTLVEQ